MLRVFITLEAGPNAPNTLNAPNDLKQLEMQLHEDVSVKLSLPERFFVLMEEPTSSFAGVVVSNLTVTGCSDMGRF